MKKAMTGRLERASSKSKNRESFKIIEPHACPQTYTPDLQLCPPCLTATGNTKVQPRNPTHSSCSELSCPIQLSTAPILTPSLKILHYTFTNPSVVFSHHQNPFLEHFPHCLLYQNWLSPEHLLPLQEVATF